MKKKLLSIVIGIFFIFEGIREIVTKESTDGNIVLYSGTPAIISGIVLVALGIYSCMYYFIKK